MYINRHAVREIIFIILSLILINGSQAQCPNIIWEDNFDGDSLDLNRWNIQLGDGCDINLCGWGNNELQYYQAENIEVGDGLLKIFARKEQVAGKFYTSARITTKNKGDWSYGRFEARIKLPYGQGIWPAFWMLSSSEPYGSWPQSGEIDILELIGSEPATAHGTIHFGQVPPNNRSTTSSYMLNEGIFNDAFHIFAIEWDVNIIRWYVDDYLYFTQTSSVTGGSKWPFDHDFHFLLNLAVGGNWPGSPNATTQFPQTMEVDYVRVMDGFLPSINGARTVENQAKSVEYNLNNLPPGAEIMWKIPENASLVSGQGEDKVTVDWNDSGGTIEAIYKSECTTDTLKLDVKVLPALALELTLENFDDPAQIDFNFSTGTLSDNFDNPGANDINSSSLCGKYIRNANEQYDVLVYDISVLDDVSDYFSTEKKFYLDLYTDAPAGTQVLLQLENKSKSEPANYPIGRNSRFEARTTTQGAWQRLELTFLDRPDPNTPNTSIDQLIFLFGPNTNLGSTFYLDNFESYARADLVDIEAKLINRYIKVFPNPASEYLMFDTDPSLRIHNFKIYGVYGDQALQIFPEIGKHHSVLDISGLPKGVYILQLQLKNGDFNLARFIKS